MLQETNIRLIWDQVRPGLEYVGRVTQQEWRPEDIYAACVANEAFLFCDEAGFVVVEPQTNRFTDERDLLVWVAYGKGGDCFRRYESELVAIAHRFGASQLVAHSPRKGFGRLTGWKAVCTKYRRPV